MAKRLDFERVAKQQKIITNGASSTWEDKPEKERFVSLKRFNQIKSEERKKLEKTHQKP